MATGDKKNMVDGWRIVGSDTMGRPLYAKEPEPQHRNTYKDAVSRAVNPMSDMGKKFDKKKVENLPQEFWNVFYGSGWEEVQGGDMLIGRLRDPSGNVAHEVMMHQKGNDTMILVDGELKAALSPAEKREISLRYAENTLGGEPVNRKHIQDIVFSGGSDGVPQQVTFTTLSGNFVHYVDNEDGETFSGYHVDRESGEKVLINDHIPAEDAVEIANMVSKEESGDTPIGKLIQAGVLAKYGYGMYKKNRRKKGGDFPFPFEKSITKFFGAAVPPFS